MRLKQLAERRVAATSGDSLRALSQKEVQQVAGGLYFSDFPMPMPGMPGLPGFPGKGGGGGLWPSPLDGQLR